MKIALVHTRLLHRGGLETRLFSYMRFLREAGHEVTVIVGKVGKGVTVPEGVRIIRLKVRWCPKVFRAWIFDRALGRLLNNEKFDFVLSLGRTSHHDAVLLPGNHLGYLRAMGKKRKSVSDRMQTLVDRKAYEAPGRILACSKMMEDEVVELYGANAEKCEVLFPPIDARRFNFEPRKERDTLRKKWNVPRDAFMMAFVSASHGRKGLPLLLEAMKSLDPNKFHLVVAGYEAVNSTLPNVHFLGFLKETELLYAAADVMVLPAKYEPFGQVVAESLMVGTPVLVSDQVGAAEIVKPEVGRVLPLKTAAWVKAIQDLAENPLSVPENYAKQFDLDLPLHMARILEGIKH